MELSGGLTSEVCGGVSLEVAVWLMVLSGGLMLEVCGGVSLEMVVWLVPGGAQWRVDFRSVWWCES